MLRNFIRVSQFSLHQVTNIAFSFENFSKTFQNFLQTLGKNYPRRYSMILNEHSPLGLLLTDILMYFNFVTFGFPNYNP